jgi:hypothetical protein
MIAGMGWRVRAGLGLAVLGAALGCDSPGGGAPTAAPTQGAPPARTTPSGAPPVKSTAPTAAPMDSAALHGKIDGLLPELRKIARTEGVVKAVKGQNAKKVSLDDIKKLDGEWSKATGITDAMKPYLENDCAASLKKAGTTLPSLVEAFAMDDQGALVCSVSKTSDFWQGDEDKWQKSFAGGKGAEFVDKPKFDESSQAYSVQVSLPVLDDGKAIGAITVGLSLDKL